MRVVMISDTHGAHRKVQLPEGDILIHAGDFMNSGLNWMELVDFNAWLGEQKFKHKIVIAGNHDIMLMRNPGLSRRELTNCTYLENDGVTIEGINFWGSPITPTFFNWAFMADRGPGIKRYWDRIPNDTDVLITHGPPYGCLDQIKASDPNHDEHLGCADLRDALERVNPSLHLFGHIHGGHGVGHLTTPNPSQRNRVYCVNASIMTEAYKPTNKPVVGFLDTNSKENIYVS